MSKNRIKITAVAIPRTRADMEALAGEIAALKICQTQAAAAMDAEINAVRTRYADFNGKRQMAIDERMGAALAWSEAHKADFGDAKSIAMTHAVIGYRTGQPQLKTLKGWTWDRVLESVRTIFGTDWLRIKVEVDKAKLLSVREGRADDFPRIGVRVVQEETFYVEPKVTEVENRETLDAKEAKG